MHAHASTAGTAPRHPESIRAAPDLESSDSLSLALVGAIAQVTAYHAAHRMFERAGAAAGTGATLHSLRHTAAYRMAEDPALPLTDVQFVLGHALLTTTQLYLTPPRRR